MSIHDDEYRHPHEMGVRDLREAVPQASDDRGMEMLAKVFGFGAAVAVVLSVAYVAWVALS